MTFVGVIQYIRKETNETYLQWLQPVTVATCNNWQGNEKWLSVQDEDQWDIMRK